MGSHHDLKSDVLPGDQNEDDMVWHLPRYTTDQIDEAGRFFANPVTDWDKWPEAYDVLDNWRRAHNYPLNAIQAGLRYKATKVCSRALFARRIKRYVAIRDKLKRFRQLKLSELQDLGGCRVVLDSIHETEQVVLRLRQGRQKHELLWEKDYINEPKKSGYRSHHLIFGYKSDSIAGKPFSGLRIEVQVRTQLQHVWATAVETVGTFTQQALKSSMGSLEWLRFFALMGTVMASREGKPAVPNTPSDPATLKAELTSLYSVLDVSKSLAAYNAAITLTTEKKVRNSTLRLIILNFETRTLEVREYSANEGKRAFDEYSQIEQQVVAPGKVDAVLVGVDSLAQLKSAYPNYNLDMRRFVEVVAESMA